MTWLSFFIGYCVGMTICLLIMIQFIKAKEENELDDWHDDSLKKEINEFLKKEAELYVKVNF
ncbi:hypothetical protein H9I32_21845 [Bacillus sp. Xin]|uniref:hypothetical protein n=1 Tax=unclassified Bacillus (in: firmicutes) TaxID=185979 RepID=UPI001574E6D6|nr:MULTISPECIES: hypothetical protein [unclassified Bacillus (in: firmicutes)]MBC6974923.1 hypothetical protein [Bacillus sp. Xin]NSW38738.1 hypothetical protein [Bacillus sp. Xin1]